MYVSIMYLSCIKIICLLHFGYIGLVSNRASFNSLGEGASTAALVGYRSSDGVKIKIPFGIGLCITSTSLVKHLFLLGWFRLNVIH